MKALWIAPIALLIGCMPASKQWSGNPDYTPEVQVAPPPLVDGDGGFVYGGGSLYSRRKARQVGDLVTIKIVHDTQADSSANTTLRRNGEVNASVSALFGLKAQIEGLEGGPSLGLETSTTNDYTGSGGTGRKGSLRGTVTGRVMEVLNNGHLVIAGRQAVMVNNEVEYLGLRGIVDARSIRSDNTVESTQLADIRIEYTGQGVVAGKQRPGWFTRLLDMVTPF